MIFHKNLTTPKRLELGSKNFYIICFQIACSNSKEIENFKIGFKVPNTVCYQRCYPIKFSPFTIIYLLSEKLHESHSVCHNICIRNSLRVGHCHCHCHIVIVIIIIITIGYLQPIPAHSRIVQPIPVYSSLWQPVPVRPFQPV